MRLTNFSRLVAIVEHGGARRDVGQAVDDRLKVRRVVARPVRQRVHLARRPNRAAVPRVAEVDRAVLDRDLQKAPQPVERVLLLERPLARHRKDDEVVVKALGAAESMQRIGHVVTISRSGARRWRAAAAEADVGLGALEVVAEPLENRRDHRVVALRVAADAGANRHHRVDALLDVPHQPDDLLGARDRHLDLDDGREHLLVEDVLADGARGHVAHERGDRVLLLEGDAGRQEMR